MQSYKFSAIIKRQKEGKTLLSVIRYSLQQRIEYPNDFDAAELLVSCIMTSVLNKKILFYIKNKGT